MKKITSIFNYIRNSFEDEKGHLSYKRISQFIFLGMMIKLSLFRITNAWEYYTFLTFAILYFLTASIISIPQIITILKITAPILRKEKSIPSNEVE